MFTADDTRMSEEFIKNITESSARLATAWSDAIKTAGGHKVYEDYEKLMRSWIDSSEFMKILDSTSMGLKFKEFVNLAAQDLPEMFKHAGDTEKMTQIKDKWMQYYGKMLPEMFGMCAPSQFEQFMAPWRSCMESLSSFRGASTSPFGFMSGSTGWPFPFHSDSSQGIFPMWSEMYENTVGKLIRLPGFGFTREYEEEFKQAVDAQIRFLNTLPDFQALVITASKAAMEKVFDHISKMDIKEFGPETYRLFYKVWISSNEDAFIGLFRSDIFCRTLGNTINKGLEAKKKMDGVIAKGLSLLNIPSDKDMDEVYQAVYEMKKKTRQLEQELDDLKRRIADNPAKEPVS